MIADSNSNKLEALDPKRSIREADIHRNHVKEVPPESSGLGAAIECGGLHLMARNPPLGGIGFLTDFGETVELSNSESL
jgi:hypothetical protein